MRVLPEAFARFREKASTRWEAVVNMSQKSVEDCSPYAKERRKEPFSRTGPPGLL